jgi:ribosomal protein S28E/S33
MSRGLGGLQRDVKQMLDRASQIVGPIRFADIRALFVVHYGAKPGQGDKLKHSHERSLKRALKGLVDRGDVVIVSGHGGQVDPHRYVTVERFAAATGEEIKDTAHAKQIVAELNAGVADFTAKLDKFDRDHPASA